MAIALIALVAITMAAWTFGGRETHETRYRTDIVTRGDLIASVTATGTVNPVKTVQVGTYVSGPVQAVDVDYNSPVTKGQRVAKIDPRPFALRVQQSEAALANARARLAKSRADLDYKRANLERNRKLQSQGIIAADAIDVLASSVAQARAEVTLQEAETRQAEAQLEETRVNLGYTDILSPVDGVVVSRNVDVGQTVAATFQTPTLFVIAEDLTKMQVNANVSEADIGDVRAGQSASFSVDAYPERTFTGTVSQVRNSPLNVQNVITYDVVIDAANADLALRPGMTANVTIVTGRREQALRVPIAALRFRPPVIDGKAVAAPVGAAVWRLVDGRPEAVAVETALADDSYTEIRSDALHEGDAVIVAVEHSKTQSEGTSTQRPPGFNMGGGARRR